MRMSEARKDKMPIFAARFSGLRGDRTQAEFAEFLGISRPTVGFYENGERIPDALVLKQIAERCGVTTDYLVGLSDVKTIDRDLQTINNITGLSEEAIHALEMLNCVLDVSSYKPDNTCDLESVVPMNIVNKIIENPSFILAITDFCQCIKLTKQAEKVIITNSDLEDLRKRHHEVIEAGATIIRGSELSDYLLHQAEDRLSLCIRGIWIDAAFNSNPEEEGANNADNPETR